MFFFFFFAKCYSLQASESFLYQSYVLIMSKILVTGKFLPTFCPILSMLVDLHGRG